MYKLREIERKDLKIINSWRNDPEIIDCLGAPYRYINSETDEKWFENYMHNRATQVRCAVVNDKEDRILGLVSLVGIDSINQSGTFHIMIGDPDNQGKGIGTFAIKEMLKHGFLDLNLRRIELGVLEDNKRAQSLYQKSGFIYEGCKRKAKFKNGKFVNMLIFSILYEEYVKQS